MGKISDYTRVLAAKLADVFVVDQTDNGTTETKSATVEQIGTAIGTLQNFADLDTSNKNLVDAINEIASYTPVYGNTASGAIATFDTSLSLPLQDCTIAINAVQEGTGTPSPQNVRNLVGFTGANIKLFGANLISGDTYQVGANVVLIGESAGDTYSTYLKATTYTISFTRPTSKTFRLDLTDSNGEQTRLISGGTATSKTFTITTEGYYKFGTYISGGMTSADIGDVMLVEGSDVKPYKPYTPPTTTAITWQDEAGTVYGGYLDVTSGKLTVTHGIITFDGSGDEIWNDGTIRYSIEIADCERTAGRLEVLCNRGVYESSGGSEGTVFVTNTYFYYYPPTSITSLADFKTWLGSNNLVVVYPLETPVTYQLTPTQISAIVGTNNVFTDTNGDTSVVYACSLKDYIEGQ